MVNWPETLVREIADRRAVLFVGSGISKSAVPTLPTWPALLKEVGEKAALVKDKKLIARLISTGRLLDAAELAISLLNPAEKRQFLEAKFRLAPVPNSEIYSNLLSLDFKVTITTNYDQLIEKNFEHYSGGQISHQVRLYTYKNFLADLRSPARTILKIHGCVTAPEDVVLDRRSYFRAKAENAGIYETVSALTTVNTVLFLGYSINDPDIQIILETVHAKTKTDHTHYALMSKFEHPSLRAALSDTYNISFVEYPNGSHGEVPVAVNDLWTAVKEDRAGRGIP